MKSLPTLLTGWATMFVPHGAHSGDVGLACLGATDAADLALLLGNWG